MNKEVTEYIENAQPEHRKIMEVIRSIIHQKVENVTEQFKWSRPVFKTTKDFAYLQASKSYVTLGFTKDIIKLNDPNNLLEGNGKTMRHIKIRKASDIDAHLLSEWIAAITIENE